MVFDLDCPYIEDHEISLHADWSWQIYVIVRLRNGVIQHGEHGNGRGNCRVRKLEC